MVARMSISLPIRGLVAVMVAAITTIGAPIALSQAAPSAADVSRVTTTTEYGAQREVITVYSASMKREIPLDVLRPADRSRPAPVFYLLNGAGGGEDSASWAVRTQYQKFFANKHVTVVTPLSGAFSYYTDWQRRDRKLGVQKWQTFLTKELPPLMDRYFHSTGRKAIAGISMAGTSVLNLAIAAPGLYRMAASYSGCARTSDKAGQAYIRTVVESRGGADTRNMWGPYDGPGWVKNDPYVNAAKLRGTQIYLSSSSGLPGQDESVDVGSTVKEGVTTADRVVVGGAIEAVTNVCTQQMGARLAQLRIPARVVIRPTGTHSWGYWERELHNSWPMIAKSLR